MKNENQGQMHFLISDHKATVIINCLFNNFILTTFSSLVLVAKSNDEGSGYSFGQ